MANQLTPDQLAALIAFANRYGRQWKNKIRHVWDGGAADFRPEHIPALLQLRNERGPTWLTNFSLPRRLQS